MALLGIPVIGDLITGITDIVGKAVVDKDKKNEIILEIEKLGDQANQRAHDEMMGQIGVNNTEAANRSIFIAGWRPFIGWVCGTAIAWKYIVSPLVEFVAKSIFHWGGVMPVIDATDLIPLVMAMLGVGAMRSYDKMKGTSNDVLSAPAPLAYPDDKPGFPKSILPKNIPWLN